MTKILTLALLCLATASFLSAQTPAIELKLQLLPDGESWGVFAKPKNNISPSLTTITGSAQVTVVMPLGFQWNSLVNHAGTWSNNATAPGPAENPGRTYTSFGLVTDNPKINYISGQETLLFTFKGISSCPDSLYLIDNENDPFAVFPNSFNNNPLNDISVLDLGISGIPIYNYSNNYAPSAWSCDDCDSDGIPNALEDTNGDGAWTPGVDVSDICGNSCGLIISLHPQDLTTCSNLDAIFGAGIQFPIGTSTTDKHFQWQQSTDGGETWSDLTDGLSGQNMIYGSQTDSLATAPLTGLHGTQYRMAAWASGCDPVFTNAATLTVEGPLEVTTHPQNTTLCPDESAVFSASVTNAGAGNVIFKWQTTSNGGISWTDISEGSPTGFGGTFTGTATESLIVSKVKGLEEHKFRLHARTGTCDWVFSNAAQLQVDGSLCPSKKCVQLKLEYQPAKANWAVKLRAKPGSPATTGNVLTSASITLVAPQNFDYQNFTSKKGVWELSGTLENPAENPGMKYLTFELQPGATSLNLGPWTETTLFTFKKMGDCPDSLYLMNGMIPLGLEPNEIKGHGLSNGQTHTIQLCGVYDPTAWSCLSPAPPVSLPIDEEIMLQFVRDNKTATGQTLENQRITTTGEPARFSVSPNPATNWLDISFENNRPEANATLRLLNLQGQPLHLQNLQDTGRLRLDLTALPPAVYFLTLEVEGKVVQREKVVKF